jgi:predicted permease
MDRLRQDLIVSLRRLRLSPGFTLCAVLTLALGIGANTAIFTAVNTLVFRPLPVDRPDQLIFLNRGGKFEIPTQSFPDYRDFRDRNNVLSGLIAYGFAPIGFSQGPTNNARIWSYMVSGNYFDLLGVKAIRGRVLHPEDDQKKGAHPVAVLSYSFWQRRFAADADPTGKTIKLNGLDYTVVGVAPRGFFGTELIFTPDIWVPMAMQPQIQPGNDWVDRRGSENTFVLGRLKPGITRQQAEANLNAIAAQLGREYPDDDAGMTVKLSPPGLVGTYFRGAIVGFSAVLMTVAGLVLLIACVNLASLLLARASDRRREIAIRLALGASRSQLMRQLLTESALLSIAGGTAGLLLALWLMDLFAAWRPPIDIPVFPSLQLDYRVLIFAACASILTGLAFGFAPALQATRTSVAPALKIDAPLERLRRWQLRDCLVAAQVALSVVLLVGSVLVVRSLQRALSLQLGFEPQHTSVVSFDLALQGYREPRGREFHRRLLEGVRALPGIQSAGLIDGLPLSLNIRNDGIYLEGKPAPRAADLPFAAMYRVTPGYFATARTRVIAGRDFDEHDKSGSKLVVIVNQAFAQQLLPNENPIGKRIRHGLTDDWKEIVGVVEQGKYRSLGETPLPAVFRPFEQDWASDTTVIARSSLPERDVANLLRGVVAQLDPVITVANAGSMTDQLGLALFPARLVASVLGAFGLLAVVLAATGVYGIAAYAVARRTREIGIRMALGATSSDILQAVLGRAAWLLMIGTTTGVVLALTGGRFFSVVLYDISPHDPFTYILALALITAVALIACWFPMRRAMGVEPLAALRTE